MSRLRRRSLTLAAALCSATISLSALMAHPTISYAVSYEGTTFEIAGTYSDINAAVQEVQRQASDILGVELPLAEEVTVTPHFGQGDTTAQELPEALLMSVDGIAAGCGLYLDGSLVAAAPDRETAESAVSSLLDEVPAGQRNAHYADEPELREGYYPEADLVSGQELEAAIGSEFTIISTSTLITETLVPYTTIYDVDEDAYEEEMKPTLISRGSDGVLRSEYEITLENGVETGRVLKYLDVISEMEPEVIAIAGNPGSRYDSKGYYLWPVSGTVTSGFGKRNISGGTSNHRGLDIAAPAGTEIHAADGGVVMTSGKHDSYGNFVQIKHDNGDITLYAHMKKRLVSVGDRVAQGDVIGLVGSTGQSTGNHCHFEVRPGGGSPVDPLKYLPKEQTQY